MLDVRNVFISHVHEDDERVRQLKDILAGKGMEVRDSSITSDKFNDASSESYIKGEILAPRIRWAGVMVVIVSPSTKDSDFVNWEIEYAQKQGMRIVGVWAHGEADCERPDALKDYADAMVGWNAQAIVDAIDGGERWENPDGTATTAQAIRRHNC